MSHSARHRGRGNAARSPARNATAPWGVRLHGHANPHVAEGGGTQRRLVAPASFASVMCWCQRKVVLATSADIARGRTESCGRKDCHE